MGFSLVEEVYVFLSFVVTGMIISVVYDLFRIMRKKSDSGMLFSNIYDIVFLVVSVFIMFLIIVLKTGGILRGFYFFALLFGAFLYFLLLSKTVIFVIRKFIDIFLNIFEFFLKILLTPIRFTYKIIYVFLSFIFKIIRRLLKRFKRFFSARFDFCRNLIIKK